MREFEYTFDKGLTIGLRPHHKNPRNSQALIQCHNLKVTSHGLQPFEPFRDLRTELGDTESYWDDGFVDSGFVEDPDDGL